MVDLVWLVGNSDLASEFQTSFLPIGERLFLRRNVAQLDQPLAAHAYEMIEAAAGGNDARRRIVQRGPGYVIKLARRC